MAAVRLVGHAWIARAGVSKRIWQLLTLALALAVPAGALPIAPPTTGEEVPTPPRATGLRTPVPDGAGAFEAAARRAVGPDAWPSPDLLDHASARPDLGLPTFADVTALLPRVTGPQAPRWLPASTDEPWDLDGLREALPPIRASNREPHAPIVVRSDADFTAENGVRHGSGTAADPYVISDWDIPSVGDNVGGVSIAHTRSHAIVRNVVAGALVPDAPCPDHVAGLYTAANEGDPSMFTEPQAVVDCLTHTANHWIDTATEDVERFGADVPVRAFQLTDVHNVRLEAVQAGYADVAGCTACAVDESAFIYLRAAELDGASFTRNTFAHLHVLPFGSAQTGGRDIEITDNHQAGFAGFFYGIQVWGDCPAQVDRNLLEGLHANLGVECVDPASTWTANDNRIPGFGDLYLAGGASAIVDRNTVQGGLHVGWVPSARICGNQLSLGLSETDTVDQALICENTLTDARFLALASFGAAVPGTQITFQDNTMVRSAGPYLLPLTIRGIEHVEVLDNEFEGVALIDARSNVHAAGNVFRASMLAHLCDPSRPYACQAGVLDVHHNSFEGGNGLLAFDCVAAFAHNNTFLGLAAALVADGCAAATFTDNQVQDAAGGLVLNAENVEAARNSLAGGELALYWLARGKASLADNIISGARRPVLLDGFDGGVRNNLALPFENAEFAGTTIDGGTIEVLAACTQPDVDAALAGAAYLVLLGCTDVEVAHTSTLAGILAANSTGVDVHDNLFTDVATAIQDYGSTGTTVFGNTIAGADRGYIGLRTTGTSIVNNEWAAVRADHAILYFPQSSQVHGNRFSGGIGVEVVFGSDDAITGNTLSGNVVGIFAGGSTSTTIKSNDVRDSHIWGILVVQTEDDGTAIEGNTILGARHGIGQGNGPVAISGNAVLGTYGGPGPASFQDEGLFYEHYLFTIEPLGTGLWLALEGAKDVQGNVVQGHPIGLYLEGDWRSPLSATLADNDVGHNGAGVWQVNSGRADVHHNTIHDNGWGYYTDCNNIAAGDDCGPRLTDNVVRDNARAGLFLYFPDETLSIEDNAFEGNGLGFGYVTFAIDIEVVDPPALCLGRDNWWGDATGPASDWNIGGRGDPIVCHQGVFGARVDQVTLGASDWLRAPPGAGHRLLRPALAASSTSVGAGTPVDFAATAAQPVQWLWARGDGSFAGWAAEASDAHSYRHGMRTYPAAAVARTTDGVLGVASLPVKVLPAPPTVGLAWTAPDAVVGQPVHFDGSYGSENGPSSYTWDFGDGEAAQTAFGEARTPFRGSLYFHGVTGVLDRTLGGLNAMTTQAPAAGAPKAWPVYAGLRGYCCHASVDARVDLEPNWALHGPFYAAGDLTVEFWASTLTDPIIVDDWEVRIEADGHQVLAFSQRGTTLGPVPTRVTLSIQDVEIQARQDLRVFIDADFDDVSRLGYAVHYDAAGHASRLVFGPDPDAQSLAEAETPSAAPAGPLVPLVFEIAGEPEDALRALRALGATQARAYALVPYVFAVLPAGARDAATALPGVVGVHEDDPVEWFAQDSVFTVGQVDRVRQDLGLTGQGATIAIIDGGFDVHHADLEGKVRVVDLRDGSEVREDGGLHGTAMAGVATGALGVAPHASVLGLVVGFQDTLTPMHEFMDAFEWVANHAEEENIRVVSLSAGQYCFPCDGSRPLSRMADALAMHGVLPVVAAGNGGPGAATIASPADAEYALAVGALDWKGTADWSDDQIAGFSSRGGGTPWLKPDLVAPGVAVPAPLLGGGRAAVSGTSPATPYVAAIGALLLEARPDLTPLELRALLTSTARDAGDAGPDTTYGHGVADAWAAVHAIPTARTLHPDHIYTQPGIHTVSLEVRDAFGASATATIDVPVAKAPGDPVARIGAASLATFVGGGLSFSDTSADTHGGLAGNAWAFGDGATGQGGEVQHAWTAPGDYDVTLTVTNVGGHTDTATVRVAVSDPPDQAVWYAHGTPYTNQLPATSPLRDIPMDDAPPASPVPKPWTVLRSAQAPPTMAQPSSAAAWELRGQPVHVNGSATLVVWAGTKQGHPLWVDSFLVALYADGVRVAWAEVNGSTLGPVPTELRLTMTGVDARADSVLGVAVAPKFHVLSGPQNLSDLEDPVTFWFDHALTPTRLEADVDPA